MKNKKALFSILLVFAMILTGCGKNETKNIDKEKNTASSNSGKIDEKEGKAKDGLKEVTFVLDRTPNTNHTGLYVADELGYYKDAGLKVKFVQPPEDGAEALVGSGKAQFGVSFQDYLPPIISGKDKMPLVAIGAILQHNYSGIMSRKGEGIDRPKGLEGKKYATRDLPVEKGILKDVVEKDGGDFSKVKLIPSTVMDEVSALSSKSVDAIRVYYGWAGIAAKVKDFDFDYFDFKDINPAFDFYSPLIITNQNLIDKDPELVKAFMQATKKGYEYAINNPKKSADILLKADPTIDKKLAYASQERISKKYQEDAESRGLIDPDRRNAFYKWINDEKLFEDQIPLNSNFTNEFIK